jgi:CheY-like chemotaxis protein
MESSMSKILIIDDDKMVRDTLKIIVEAAGHQTLVANDGKEGLTLHAQGKPDLVITDILMPEKEGIETVTELQRRQPRLPTVAISGGGRTANMNFLKLAETFGADRTISKPFEPEDIIRIIAELTGSPAPKPATA